ncbi:MAG TPA: hypothetical protein VMH87_07770 [Pseudomonadales bacterium]|nr:hypothetical protein [Pseudomonadales bacterium]
MSESNTSLEQRVAALEKLAESQTAFALDTQKLCMGLAGLYITLNGRIADLVSMQITATEIVETLTPENDDNRAKIRTYIRRAQSHLDQMEAAQSDAQQKFKKIWPSGDGPNPPQNPPDNPPGN